MDHVRRISVWLRDCRPTCCADIAATLAGSKRELDGRFFRAADLIDSPHIRPLSANLREAAGPSAPRNFVTRLPRSGCGAPTGRTGPDRSMDISDRWADVFRRGSIFFWASLWLSHCNRCPAAQISTEERPRSSGQEDETGKAGWKVVCSAAFRGGCAPTRIRHGQRRRRLPYTLTRYDEVIR